MPSATIEVRGFTKRFGEVTAVDGLDFAVEPGRVTGFLGPNGAGKTTTLRAILGLVKPTSGSLTIGGAPYSDLDRPMEHVGAAVESTAFHPGRSARNHLRILARAGGVPSAAVDRAIAATDMTEYADRRIGGFSLGMRQRLALAAAILGEPEVLILDEPINGLDPEGIRWIRTFLTSYAHAGNTVLLSSHLLSEVQQTVEDVLVIARGRLVFSGTLGTLAETTTPTVVVDAVEREALGRALAERGLVTTPRPDGIGVVSDTTVDVGRAAFDAGIALTHLRLDRAGGLEQAFLDLVQQGGAR